MNQSEQAWTTSSSIQEMNLAIRAAKSVIVVTHAKPDGDAIGSAFSVARSAIAAGVKTEVWLVGPVPRWATSLASGLTIREFAPTSATKPVTGAWSDLASLAAADLSIVVDTGSWSQLAELRPWLESRSTKTLLLDHHLHGDAEVASRRIIDSSCASCTQVVAPLCVSLLGLASPAKLPTNIAETLYLGLATDTGWFRYSSVTPATLRLAADLIEAGVDHTRLYALIEQQDVAARWKLLGRALSTLELADDGRIATMTLSDRDFLDTQSDRNDTGGFADMLLTIRSVQVSCVLIENPPKAGEKTLTKISMRSKPGPNAVDVNAVANTIGGGGHARAAGAKIHAGVEEARLGLLAALREVGR